MRIFGSRLASMQIPIDFSAMLGYNNKGLLWKMETMPSNGICKTLKTVFQACSQVGALEDIKYITCPQL